MMRSLWSGVSGLNAHQVAMDVEANNIANVNTVGFKYSRTNFQNLLAQTIKSATAPQGTLGGKNSLQIGLGASVSSVETMFKQGSIQNTDKNTDMAVSGDGFFVVTEDNGKTAKYTRAGDFTFDANGNFVDPNGYKVMGWKADPDTHNIDTSVGIEPIVIPPGLTTPAKETSKIQIKANLNSGDHIIEKDGTKATVDQNMDVNGLYDATGNKIVLQPETDTLKFKVVNLNNDTISISLKYGENSTNHDGKFTTLKDIIDELNYAITHDTSGNYLTNTTKYNATEYQVYLNGFGQIVDPGVNRISFDTTSNANKYLVDIFNQINGTSKTTGTIKGIQNSFIGADDVGELFNANGDAFNINDGQGIAVSIDGLYENRKFVYTSHPINGEESCETGGGNYIGEKIVSDSLEGLHWTYNEAGDKAAFSVSKDSNGTIKGEVAKFEVVDQNGDQHSYYFKYGKDFHTIADLICALNTKLSNDTISISVTFKDGKIVENDNDGAFIKNADAVKDTLSTPPDAGSPLDNMKQILDGLDDSTGTETAVFKKADTYYFHDIEDLVYLWQMAVNDSNDPLNNERAINNTKGIVSINDDGKITIKNTSDSSFNIKVEGYPGNGQDNQLFTEAFSPISGTVAAGGVAASQEINAAVHVTSLDVFDSLGSKHTLTIHFRKNHTSTSPTDPTIWKWYAEVPPPATLDDPTYGDIQFNPDGSIKALNPTNLIFNPNNGADNGQQIQLDFGTLGAFDGITSFDAPSSTSGQTQDGYPGGDLEQLVVDQTGTIIGVFTNGRSYSLAQVALAKFVNNEGLMSEGGTLFSASPNSGDPIIGTAGTGGRGSIQPSSLEMSNVDLSRSLTQLIVIQRGFQANSKTITTSDQMLNTLLQLKQ